MARDFIDTCRFIPTAGGLADFVASAAVTGYKTPAQASAVNAATYTYRAESADLSQWEEGEGTYTSSTTTLTRTTVFASSNAGAKVNFSAAPQVAVVALSLDVRALLSQPVCGHRLTLASGTPIMTGTVANASSVILTPSVADYVRIYDGTQFRTYQFPEVSQSLSDTTKSPAAAVANTNYDMFAWMDGSTPRCTRGPAYSSNTSRGTGAGTTELQMLNGIPVNKNAITNGPAATLGTQVGSIHTNGSGNVDWIYAGSALGGSAGSFGLWNAYNRTLFASQVADTTSQWNYTTAAYQQANASAGNQISIMLGLTAEVVKARVTHIGGVTSGSAVIKSGVGIDSTTVNSALLQMANVAISAAAEGSIPSEYTGFPGIGFHTFAWLEYGGANIAMVGTSLGGQSGMSLEFWA